MEQSDKKRKSRARMEQARDRSNSNDREREKHIPKFKIEIRIKYYSLTHFEKRRRTARIILQTILSLSPPPPSLKIFLPREEIKG